MIKFSIGLKHTSLQRLMNYFMQELLLLLLLLFFSIITLYTKNVKQIKNTINSAPITIYVVEGKLNVKKKKKKSELN